MFIQARDPISPISPSHMLGLHICFLPLLYLQYWPFCTHSWRSVLSTREYICVRTSRFYGRAGMRLHELSVNPREPWCFALNQHPGLANTRILHLAHLSSKRGGSIRTKPPHRVPHPTLSRSRALALRWLWTKQLKLLYGGLGTNLHGSRCVGRTWATPEKTCTSTHLSLRIPFS